MYRMEAPPPLTTTTMTTTTLDTTNHREQEEPSWPTPESFLEQLEELALEEDYDAMRDMLVRLAEQPDLSWTTHPSQWTYVLDILVSSNTIHHHAMLDIIHRIYNLVGKWVFLTPTVTGSYPLHLAVQQGSVNLVQFMSRVAPETVQLPFCGKRPIDIVTRHLELSSSHYQDPHYRNDYDKMIQDPMWACAWYLVHMMNPPPETAVTKVATPDDNMVHLCLKAGNKVPPLLTDLAMTRYPDQLSECDAQGNLPLHIVASQPPTAENTAHLRTILRNYDYAAHVLNADQQLPWQLAVSAGRTWNDGLKELLAANSQVLCGKRTQALDQMLVVKLLSSRASAAPTVVFEILRSNPSLIVD